MKVATAAQMRAIDERAQHQFGISSDVLMAEAGRQVAQEILARLSPLRVCVVCGKGNNAGDGFVVARELAAASVTTEVVCVVPPSELRGAAANAYARLRETQVPVYPFDQLEARLEQAEVIVDALLGTGIKSQPSGPFARAIELINGSPRPVVAIDVPSGVRELEPEEELGSAIQATLTVTIGLPKLALLLLPGWDYAGELVIAPINFPRELLEDESMTLNYATAEELAGWLPERRLSSIKHDFGRMGIVAGSAEFAGAAVLAARGAFRAGCGLAYIFTTADVNLLYKAALPEAVTRIVPSGHPHWLDSESADAILKIAQKFNAMAVGPGLGVKQAQIDLVRRIIAEFAQPLVIDADALTCLGHMPLEEPPHGLSQPVEASFFAGRAPCVLTPHAGEMAHLTGLSFDQVVRDRIGVAQRFAARYGVILLLKGASTIIALPNGQVYINAGATTALAKAGTGDVLTGAIASFIAQGMEPSKATILAAHVHLRAGMLAAQEIGERSVLSHEVADLIAPALVELEELQ